MINGPTVRRKLDASDNRIGRLLAAGADDREILAELYLAALCREPRPAELDAMAEYLRRARDRRSGLGRRRLGALEQQRIPAAALSAVRS